MTLFISNMTSNEDYTRIVEALQQHNGIKNIGPFTKKNTLDITYNPSIFNITAIHYLIGQLGYRLGVKRNHTYTPKAQKKGG